MRKYIFCDESGNLDLGGGRGASLNFAIGSVVIEGELARQQLEVSLAALRHELIWEGRPIYQGFHANPDSHDVRLAVFSELQRQHFRFDATVYEKRLAPPYWKTSGLDFYREALIHHLHPLLLDCLAEGDEVVLVSATWGTRKELGVIQRTLEAALDHCHSGQGRVACVRDDAEAGLQAADYCLWGLMRGREEGDLRWRDLVPHVRTEVEFFTA